MPLGRTLVRMPSIGRSPWPAVRWHRATVRFYQYGSSGDHRTACQLGGGGQHRFLDPFGAVVCQVFADFYSRLRYSTDDCRYQSPSISRSSARP